MGLLRRRRSPEGDISRTSETRGGLCRPSAPFLGRLWVSTPGCFCCLRAGGHKARRCLRTREGLGRWPVLGSSGWLGRRLPALLTPALAFARGLILRHMRRAGVGSRSGLPVRPAPCVWRIIAHAPGCIWAGPVSVVPPPVGPPLGGGVGRVTRGRLLRRAGEQSLPSHRRHVSPIMARHTSPGCGRTGDKLHGRLYRDYHSRGPGGALRVPSGGRGIGAG